MQSVGQPSRAPSTAASPNLTTKRHTGLLFEKATNLLSSRSHQRPDSPVALQRYQAQYSRLQIPENSNDHSSDGHSTEIKQPLPLSKRRSPFAIWRWEAVALFVSMSCIAAIIGILAGMKDKLSTNWQVGLITINAAITGLSTIASIGLAFAVPACLGQEKWRYFHQNEPQRLRHFSILDEGSNGPISAFKVLWSIRRSLTAMASLVIILDATTNFLIQQAVVIEPGHEMVSNTDSPAYFSYAQGYDFGAYPADNRAQANSDFSMQAAIFRGLSGTEWTRSFSCSSNCTWPASKLVLGFSSACANVTDRTVNLTQILPSGQLSQNLTASVNLTTPGVIVFTFGWMEGGASGDVPAAMLQTTPVKTNTTIFNGSFMRLALFSNNLLDHSYEGTHWVTLPVSASVIECDIAVSAWNYSGITSDHNNLNIASRVPVPLVDGSFSGYKHENGMDSPPYVNYTIGGNILSVNLGYIDTLQDFFASSAIQGTVHVGLGGSSTNMNLGAVQAFTNKSVSDVMDRVTLSMTDIFQQGKTAQRAYGLTQVSVNYIRVYWRWTYLPIAVEFLALGLLICTMASNRQGGNIRQVPLWKSSRLVLLFHSINREGNMSCDVQSPEELKMVERNTETRVA